MRRVRSSYAAARRETENSKGVSCASILFWAVGVTEEQI